VWSPATTLMAGSVLGLIIVVTGMVGPISRARSGVGSPPGT
jgi:hypothetical protein